MLQEMLREYFVAATWRSNTDARHIGMLRYPRRNGSRLSATPERDGLKRAGQAHNCGLVQEWESVAVPRR